MAETRKILGTGEALGISATCARVPVLVGHSQSLNLQTRDALSPDEARELLSAAPGVVVVDAPADGVYPLATAARAATTCSSGAYAATPRTSAASTSGSWATTCARARPPTPSSSPSCCTSAA